MGKSIWDTRFGKRGIAKDERVQVEEGDSWKTIHGAHVLLGDDGRIKAGAGGKFTGVTFKGNTQKNDKDLKKRPSKEEYYEHMNKIEDMLGKIYDKEIYNKGYNSKNPPPKDVMYRVAKLQHEAVMNYLGEHEYRNEVQKLDKHMPEQAAIKDISGLDLAMGGSCVSVSIALMENQYHDGNAHDFRDGVSQLAVAMSATNVFAEIAESEFDPTQEGGGLWITNRLGGEDNFAKEFAALDAMQPNKNYVTNFGRHQALVRKTKDGEIQFLELQSGRENIDTWHKMIPKAWEPPEDASKYTEKQLKEMKEDYDYDRETRAYGWLQRRFLSGDTDGSDDFSFVGVVPADKYVNTKTVRDLIPYINTAPEDEAKSRSAQKDDRGR